MKSHLFIPLALALGFSGAAFAEDVDRAEANNETAASAQSMSVGSAFAAETMEHVDTNTAPIPEVAGAEKTEANKFLIEEQNREQQRQEMLREQNRRALLRSVRSAQVQQVRSFLQEGQKEQQVVQETAPLLSIDPELLLLDTVLPLPGNDEAERTAPATEAQVEDDKTGEPAQEPS